MGATRALLIHVSTTPCVVFNSFNRADCGLIAGMQIQRRDVLSSRFILEEKTAT
jgi:hypothetical protein